MVLKVLSVCSCIIISSALFASDAGRDLKNFRYSADARISIDQNLFKQLSNVIAEPDVIAYVKALRTFSLQDKPVKNVKALKDRILNDEDKIYKKAYYYGFYDTQVQHKIYFNRRPVTVDMRIDFGSIFNLKLNLHFVGKDEEFRGHYEKELMHKLRTCKASMPDMEQLVSEIEYALKQDGFVNPIVIEKKAQVKYERHFVELNVVVDPGEKVSFANTQVHAFDGISQTFIKNRIEWKDGELFNVDKVRSTSKNLKDTQIFSKVSVKPDVQKMSDGKVPMVINLEEEKKHTIGISLLYSGARNMNFERKSNTQKSLKSILARLYWERNNAFSGGEKVNVIVEGTPTKISSKRSDYAFETTLMQPDVFIRNGTMTYGVSRRQDLTNVFFRKSDKGSVLFGYPINKHLSVTGGALLEQNYLDGCEVLFVNTEENRRYKCLSLPFEIKWDRTNDLLNPTSGYRVIMKLTKSFLRGASITDLSNANIATSYNLPLDDTRRTVIACSVKLSKIFQHKIDDIPIDKRIYAGGMNSVRGYANQMAGEVIAGELAPLGGKASIEFNSEFRRRFNNDFGGVIFFDGAKVSDNKSKFSNIKLEKRRWFCSIGVGGRYFSSIGPIRVDLAFPIKRRKGIDSKMQFIMSLGQAF